MIILSMNEEIIQLIDTIKSKNIMILSLDNTVNILLDILYAMHNKLPYNITLYKENLTVIITKFKCTSCYKKASFINNKNELFCWFHAHTIKN
jgi:hypothetical protein